MGCQVGAELALLKEEVELLSQESCASQVKAVSDTFTAQLDYYDAVSAPYQNPNPSAGIFLVPPGAALSWGLGSGMGNGFFVREE